MNLKLFDRRRYVFDDDDLFSHSHEPDEESPTFPWWKPRWNGSAWEFVNPNGKVLDTTRLYSTLYPTYSKLMREGAEYEHSPKFFVDWAKKIVYYMSCAVYMEAERENQAAIPKGLSPKEATKASKEADRKTEATIQEFFNSFKE